MIDLCDDLDENVCFSIKNSQEMIKKGVFCLFRWLFSLKRMKMFCFDGYSR
jgi:hypothetical protein